jgi:hypothetical protein
MSAHLKVLAKQLAQRFYLPTTWPNVNTIAAAIELVAFHSNVPAEEAAELLVACARERTFPDNLVCPSERDRREISRVNTVDRFWFEDARWRCKDAYAEFYERTRAGKMIA